MLRFFLGGGHFKIFVFFSFNCDMYIEMKRFLGFFLFLIHCYLSSPVSSGI